LTSLAIRTAVLIPAWLLAISPGAVGAQEPDTARSPLDALVREALERSPRVAAAGADARSLAERVSRAGAWEDPVLTLGFTNLRTTSLDFSDDFMTMKVVQLGQTVPLPGQVGHRREAAALQSESATHLVEAVRIQVVAEVKRAYAELYYRDRALAIVDRNLAVLRGLEEVTRARYATGASRQPAVLRAGLEIDGLEAQRVVLAESRRAALARLNALRDRPAGTPVGPTALPPGLLSLLPLGAGGPGFPSALEVGRPGASPGLPPLDSLVARAVARKPELRAHVARIRAQEETVDLARARRWPAPRIAVGYGQREGFPDMLNASLSFGLPVFAGAKQHAAVREEREALARERSLHDRMVREIERDVTAAHAEVTDALGRLALYERGILARARANLEATIAAYRSGAEDFLALLDSQTTLYRHELDHRRRLADLLAAWAGLERAVGGEITP
jgi:outer membrane protein TolC